MHPDPFRVILADQESAVRTGSTWLSKELQVGKAAEHLVCCELILSGFNAFLADAGQPYDLLVDTGERVVRLQVKATQKPYRYRRSDGRTSNSYRFGLRRGRGSHNRIDPKLVDAIAFVALDTRRVAYLWVSDLIRPDGKVSGIAEFCDESDRRRWGSRTFQKCAQFPPATGQPGVRACFRCGTERPATVEHFPPNKSGSGVLGVCRPCIRRSDLANRRARKGATA